MRPTALTIAGSDSSGGAGIAADLRTFAALGVHGCAAITAITAQSSAGVRGMARVEPALIRAQVEASLDERPIGAVKTGMLFDAEIVTLVGALCAERGLAPVVDPVIRATSGTALLSSDAIRALRSVLFPRARLVTPNLPEVASLTGRPVRTIDDMVRAAETLIGDGALAVLVKGGHRAEDASDVLVERGAPPLILEGARIDVPVARGTGCTLSAAIAAFLARGLLLADAVRAAKVFVRGALEGAHPLHHHFTWYA